MNMNKWNLWITSGFLLPVVISMLAFTGCEMPTEGTAITLESIMVTTAPTKTIYVRGEAFDPAGIVVIGIYSNGTYKIEIVTADQITGYNTNNPGNQILTVKVNKKLATFMVTVTEPGAATLESIAITTPPVKTAYTTGEDLNIAGLVVTGTYSDFTTKTEIVTTANISGYYKNNAGTYNLTVTVNGKTANFAVTVSQGSAASQQTTLAGRASFGNLHGGQIRVTIEKTNGLQSVGAQEQLDSARSAARAIGGIGSIGLVISNLEQYVFENIDPGTYTVYASSIDESEQAVIINAPVEEGKVTTNDDMTVLPVGSITGQIILDNSTTGNLGFFVFIAGTSYMATTNAAGYFTMSSVPPGINYEIAVVKGNYAAIWTDANVTSGEITNLPVLRLSPSDVESGFSWQGTFSSPPNNPQKDWAYLNSTDRQTYIYDGNTWQVMSQSIETNSVIYNGNGHTGGTVPIDSGRYVLGASAKIRYAGNLSRTNYRFIGWSLSADGSGRIYNYSTDNNIGTILFAEDEGITLYAIWSKEHTITFSGNGNTGGIAPRAVTGISGESISVPVAGTLSKDQHRFIGWNTEPDGSGTSYRIDVGQVINFTGDTTIYAEWVEEYTITYNGNGSTRGILPPSVKGITGESTIIPSDVSLVKDNYRFVGWNTQADGNGTSYGLDTEQRIYFTTGNITLYAEWAGEYTITYSGNGSTSGILPPSVKGITGEYTTIPSSISLSKDKYRFTGWNTKADGSGISYRLDTEQKIYFTTGNITIYAEWTEDYTVTYDGNGNTGGTVPVDTGRYALGASAKIRDVGSLQRTNYRFIGWSLSSDGSGKIYNYSNDTNGTILFTEADKGIMLYAVWSREYTITFNGNGNTGGMAPRAEVGISGESTSVPGSGTLSKDRHRFVGWNTEPEGSGTSYRTDAGQVINFTGDTTIYAEWAEEYTITYNGNGNTGGFLPTSAKGIIGEYTTIPNDLSPVKDGYHFNGWNTKADGTGTAYSTDNGQVNILSFVGNITIYAAWIPIHTVFFNGNGNSYGNNFWTEKYYEGQEVYIPNPEPAVGKADNFFSGWNTQADGSGTACRDMFTMGAEDIVLNAIWSEFSLDVLDNNTKVRVTGYAGSQTNLVIPDTIGGLPVTEIGSYAFNGRQLTSVTIPNTVTTIGGYAFQSNNLGTVNIPNSVTSIEYGAFNSSGLTGVVLGSKLKTIGYDAFSYNQITEIVIPDSVTDLGYNAFYSNRLVSVQIGNGLTTIASNAFGGNEIRSLTIGNHVTTIESYAFSGNYLTAVSIPDSVTNIASYAFGTYTSGGFSTITIGKDVIIESNDSFGSSYGYSDDNPFRSFYNTNGRLAGQYKRDAGGQWSVSYYGKTAITIDFTKSQDEIITFSPAAASQAVLSKSAENSIAVTVSGNYDAYHWIIDGVRQSNTGNSISVQANTYTGGKHRITAIVYKGEVPYSAEFVFTVVE